MKVDNLILQVPTNDISNISHLVNEEGFAIQGKETEVEQKLFDSSNDMVNLAKIALNKYPNINKVVLVNRPERIDKTEKMSDKANNTLANLVENLSNSKIQIASHNLKCQGLTKYQVFGDIQNRYDGIHMNGNNGKHAITNSFKNIFRQMKIKSTLN